MSRPTPFLSARHKLARGEKHYADLLDAVRDFEGTTPVSASWVENGGRTEAKASVTADAPEEIALIFGDCLHNFRAVLDQIVYAAAGDRATTRTEWPIAAADGIRPVDRKTRLRKACPGTGHVAAAVQAYVGTCEPWLGGKDEWMWLLHRLDVVDKHRLLIAANTNLTEVRLSQRIDGLAISAEAPETSHVVPGLATFEVAFQPVPTGPIADGDVFMSFTEKEYANLNGMHLRFGVGLNEPSLPQVHGKSLIRTASDFMENVGRVIREVEASLGA